MTDASKSSFVYVIFIRTTVEKLWSMLTSAEFTRQYWFGVSAESDWTAGAPWQLTYPDGLITDTGEIVEINPPKRIVIRWRNEFRPELKAEGYGRCTMELEPVGDAVKLSILHEMDLPNSKLIDAVSGGWPQVLSNLKSLIETGEIVVRR